MQEIEVPGMPTREALQRLDPLWDELFPAEQARIVQLLVERVDVSPDGADIRLRTEGLTNLVADLHRLLARSLFHARRHGGGVCRRAGGVRLPQIRRGNSRQRPDVLLAPARRPRRQRVVALGRARERTLSLRRGPHFLSIREDHHDRFA
jgi:hypothetical protein